MAYPTGYMVEEAIYGGLGSIYGLGASQQLMQNQLAAQQQAEQKRNIEEQYRRAIMGMGIATIKPNTLRESLQEETNAWLRRAFD